MKKYYYALLSLFATSYFIACSSNAKDNLIVGTWIPVNPAAINSTEIKIKFLANHIGVAERKGKTPESRDSITYEIRNNGKILFTKENSGRTEEMDIVELSNKNLILLSKKTGDTLRMVRD